MKPIDPRRQAVYAGSTVFASYIICVLGIYLVARSPHGFLIPLIVLTGIMVLASVMVARMTYTAAEKVESDRRRRVNRCVACGYDLRGSPERCSECGTVPTPAPVPEVSTKPINPWREAAMPAVLIFALNVGCILWSNRRSTLGWPWFDALIIGLITLIAAYSARGNYKIAIKDEAERREKLGLCITCGYDLRGSTSQCPECGKPDVRSA